MRCRNVSLFFPNVVLLLCLMAFGHFGQSEAFADNLKVLFLGNSITHANPDPGVGWTGSWGMAASVESNDYVHRLVASLGTIPGILPTEMDTNIFPFEIGYNSYDVNASLAAELAYEPDILVMAIGENTEPYLTTPQARTDFRNRLTNLLTTFKNLDSHPQIFVRSSYWTDRPNADAAMALSAADVGATFVSLGSIGADWLNMAGSEQQGLNPGVAIHPGDRGMLAISDILFEAIAPTLGATLDTFETGDLTLTASTSQGTLVHNQTSLSSSYFPNGRRLTDLHLESGGEIRATLNPDFPDQTDDALTITLDPNSKGNANVSYVGDSPANLAVDGRSAFEVTLVSAPASGTLFAYAEDVQTWDYTQVPINGPGTYAFAFNDLDQLSNNVDFTQVRILGFGIQGQATNTTITYQISDIRLVAAGGEQAAHLPEPTTLVLLGLGGLIVLQVDPKSRSDRFRESVVESSAPDIPIWASRDSTTVS